MSSKLSHKRISSSCRKWSMGTGRRSTNTSALTHFVGWLGGRASAAAAAVRGSGPLSRLSHARWRSLPSPLLLLLGLLSAEDLSGQFNRGTDEDRIIPHIVSLADILVGDELGVTKAQRTLIQGAPPSAWFLEILPVWVRVKGLSDMLWLRQPRVTLIQ